MNTPRLCVSGLVGVVIAGLCFGLGACHQHRHTQSASMAVVGAPDAAHKAAFDRLASLSGTWQNLGEDGKPTGTVEFALSSNKSCVREIMFPGSAHEMTNMYTLDGPELLVTHYCAMGNQPHMRATKVEANRIVFDIVSVSNMRAEEEMVMGHLTVDFTDANHITQTWRTLTKGEQKIEPTIITLQRVGS
ncbi:MAG: hypothetical protein IPK69_10930 [Phycisphaerales bacterium]|nr:MAG: hypothetical protein IPK69_10930 [Phycisphaerales bacterium]